MPNHLHVKVWEISFHNYYEKIISEITVFYNVYTLLSTQILYLYKLLHKFKSFQIEYFPRVFALCTAYIPRDRSGFNTNLPKATIVDNLR